MVVIVSKNLDSLDLAVNDSANYNKINLGAESSKHAPRLIEGKASIQHNLGTKDLDTSSTSRSRTRSRSHLKAKSGINRSYSFPQPSLKQARKISDDQRKHVRPKLVGNTEHLSYRPRSPLRSQCSNKHQRRKKSHSKKKNTLKPVAENISSKLRRNLIRSTVPDASLEKIPTPASSSSINGWGKRSPSRLLSDIQGEAKPHPYRSGSPKAHRCGSPKGHTVRSGSPKAHTVRSSSPKLKLNRRGTSPVPRSRTFQKSSNKYELFKGSLSKRNRSPQRDRDNHEGMLKFPICRVIKVKMISPEFAQPDTVCGPPLCEKRTRPHKQNCKYYEAKVDIRSHSPTESLMTSNSSIDLCPAIISTGTHLSKRVNKSARMTAEINSRSSNHLSLGVKKNFYELSSSCEKLNNYITSRSNRHRRFQPSDGAKGASHGVSKERSLEKHTWFRSSSVNKTLHRSTPSINNSHIDMCHNNCGVPSVTETQSDSESCGSDSTGNELPEFSSSEDDEDEDETDSDVSSAREESDCSEDLCGNVKDSDEKNSDTDGDLSAKEHYSQTRVYDNITNSHLEHSIETEDVRTNTDCETEDSRDVEDETDTTNRSEGESHDEENVLRLPNYEVLSDSDSESSAESTEGGRPIGSHSADRARDPPSATSWQGASAKDNVNSEATPNSRRDENQPRSLSTCCCCQDGSKPRLTVKEMVQCLQEKMSLTAPSTSNYCGEDTASSSIQRPPPKKRLKEWLQMQHNEDETNTSDTVDMALLLSVDEDEERVPGRPKPRPRKLINEGGVMEESVEPTRHKREIHFEPLISHRSKERSDFSDKAEEPISSQELLEPSEESFVSSTQEGETVHNKYVTNAFLSKDVVSNDLCSETDSCSEKALFQEATMHTATPRAYSENLDVIGENLLNNLIQEVESTNSVGVFKSSGSVNDSTSVQGTIEQQRLQSETTSFFCQHKSVSEENPEEIQETPRGQIQNNLDNAHATVKVTDSSIQSTGKIIEPTMISRTSSNVTEALARVFSIGNDKTAATREHREDTGFDSENLSEWNCIDLREDQEEVEGLAKAFLSNNMHNFNRSPMQTEKIIVSHQEESQWAAAFENAKMAIRRMRSRSLSPAQVSTKINWLVDRGKQSLSSAVKSWSNTDTTDTCPETPACRDLTAGVQSSIPYISNASEPQAGPSKPSCSSIPASSTTSLQGDAHEPIYCLSIPQYSPSVKRHSGACTNPRRGCAPFSPYPANAEDDGSKPLGVVVGNLLGDSDHYTNTLAEVRKKISDTLTCRALYDGKSPESDSLDTTKISGDTGNGGAAQSRCEVKVHSNITFPSPLCSIRTRSPTLESILETDSVSEGCGYNLLCEAYEDGEEPSESACVDELPREQSDASDTNIVARELATGLAQIHEAQQESRKNEAMKGLSLKVPHETTTAALYTEVPTRASLSDCSRDTRFEYDDISGQEDGSGALSSAPLKTQSLVNACEVMHSESGITDMMALISQEANIKRYPSFPDLTDLDDDDDPGGPGARESFIGTQATSELDIDWKDTDKPELNQGTDASRGVEIGSSTSLDENKVPDLLPSQVCNVTLNWDSENKATDHPNQNSQETSAYVEIQSKKGSYVTCREGLDGRTSPPPATPAEDIRRSTAGHNNSPQIGVKEPEVKVGTIVSLLESCKVLNETEAMPAQHHTNVCNGEDVVHHDAAFIGFHGNSADLEHTTKLAGIPEEQISNLNCVPSLQEKEHVNDVICLENKEQDLSEKVESLEIFLPSPPMHSPCEDSQATTSRTSSSGLSDIEVHVNYEDYRNDLTDDKSGDMNISDHINVSVEKNKDRFKNVSSGGTVEPLAPRSPRLVKNPFIKKNNDKALERTGMENSNVPLQYKPVLGISLSNCSDKPPKMSKSDSNDKDDQQREESSKLNSHITATNETNEDRFGCGAAVNVGAIVICEDNEKNMKVREPSASPGFFTGSLVNTEELLIMDDQDSSLSGIQAISACSGMESPEHKPALEKRDMTTVSSFVATDTPSDLFNKEHCNTIYQLSLPVYTRGEDTDNDPEGKNYQKNQVYQNNTLVGDPREQSFESGQHDITDSKVTRVTHSSQESYEPENSEEKNKASNVSSDENERDHVLSGSCGLQTGDKDFSQSTDELEDSKINFLLNEDSGCDLDLSVASQSRSHRSFSTDEDKSSGAGETLPLACDVELKQKKKKKTLKNMQSGEGPSPQPDKTFKIGGSSGTRIGGSPRALSNQNSPDLNAAGASHATDSTRVTTIPPQRPPRAVVAQKTGNTAGGHVRKEIKWDDEISYGDQEELSTQSSSELSSNRCNSCTADSIKAKLRKGNQAKQSKRVSKDDTGACSNQPRGTSQAQRGVRDSKPYRLKVLRSPPPPGVESFSPRSCLAKSSMPYIRKINALTRVSRSSATQTAHGFCIRNQALGENVPFQSKAKEDAREGPHLNQDLQLTVNDVGAETKLTPFSETTSSDPTLLEIGSDKDIAGAQEKIYSQETSIDEEATSEEAIETAGSTEPPSGVADQVLPSLSEEREENTTSSCLVRSSPQPIVLEPSLESLSSAWRDSLNPYCSLLEKHVQKDGDCCDPLGQSFSSMASAVPLEPSLASFPNEWREKPASYTAPTTPTSSAKKRHELQLDPTAHMSPNLPQHHYLRYSYLPFPQQHHMPDPPVLFTSSSLGDLTRLQHADRMNISSSLGRDFISSLSKRVRTSDVGIARAYSFVSRSQIQLDKCDRLIERSSDIIRRSQEMLATSRQQMEETVRTLSLKSNRNTSREFI